MHSYLQIQTSNNEYLFPEGILEVEKALKSVQKIQKDRNIVSFF